MKKSYYLLGAIALGLAMTSCRREASENVNQDTIYAEYRIVYDAAQDKSFARATFHFKDALGTKLELSDPAEVQFDGTTLTWQNAFAYYETEYAGLTTSGSFEYTDLDDNTFTNGVVLLNDIDFPSSLDTIHQDAAYTLSWSGSGLEAGESVIVTINGNLEGDLQTFTADNNGATSIILSKNKLEQIGVGEATITMERWHTQDLAEGTSKGGAVWSRYIAAPQTIVIQP